MWLVNLAGGAKCESGLTEGLCVLDFSVLELALDVEVLDVVLKTVLAGFLSPGL